MTYMDIEHQAIQYIIEDIAAQVQREKNRVTNLNAF